MPNTTTTLTATKQLVNNTSIQPSSEFGSQEMNNSHLPTHLTNHPTSQSTKATHGKLSIHSNYHSTKPHSWKPSIHSTFSTIQLSAIKWTESPPNHVASYSTSHPTSHSSRIPSTQQGLRTLNLRHPRSTRQEHLPRHTGGHSRLCLRLASLTPGASHVDTRRTKIKLWCPTKATWSSGASTSQCTAVTRRVRGMFEEKTETWEVAQHIWGIWYKLTPEALFFLALTSSFSSLPISPIIINLQFSPNFIFIGFSCAFNLIFSSMRTFSLVNYQPVVFSDGV